MQEVIQVGERVLFIMAGMLVAGLMMGQRHVGRLSVFDLLTGIAMGSVAGAGLVDPSLSIQGVLASMAGLALLHYAFTWLEMKWMGFGRLVTFEPIVVVQHGRPLRAAMQKVRLTLSGLLPLLRENGVFDFRQVEYAVLEGDGKLTVLKSSDQPPASGLRRPVIVDGHVERAVLREMGWDVQRLHSELIRQGISAPKQVFVAMLDEQGELYLVPQDKSDEGPQIRH